MRSSNDRKLLVIRSCRDGRGLVMRFSSDGIGVEVIRFLRDVSEIFKGSEPVFGVSGTSSEDLGRAGKGLLWVRGLVAAREKERRSLLRSACSEAAYVDAWLASTSR
jgi:hypothetical protein